MEKTQSEPSSPRTIFHDLALLALIAPVAGLALNLILSSAHAPWDSKWRSVSTVLVPIGLLAGLCALIGIPKYGTRKILGSALTGIVLAAAVLGYSAFVLRQPAGSTDDAFNDYAGWAGGGSALGAQFTFVSIHPESAPSRAIAARIGTNVLNVSLAIDNANGTNTLLVDPTLAELILISSTKVAALRAEAISGPKADPSIVKKITGARIVRPGEQALDVSSVFPVDTDLTKVAGIALRVNGQILLFSGQYMTLEQKQALKGSGAKGAVPPGAAKVDAAPALK